MEQSSATCLPTAAYSLGSSVSLSAHLQGLPDFLCCLSPTYQAIQLLLTTALPLCRLCPHPTDKNQALALAQRCYHHPALSFSFCLLFLSLARVGEKEVGGPWGEQSPHGLLTGSSYQSEKGGALLPPDR